MVIWNFADPFFKKIKPFAFAQTPGILEPSYWSASAFLLKKSQTLWLKTPKPKQWLPRIKLGRTFGLILGYCSTNWLIKSIYSRFMSERHLLEAWIISKNRIFRGQTKRYFFCFFFSFSLGNFFSRLLKAILKADSPVLSWEILEAAMHVLLLFLPSKKGIKQALLHSKAWR